jgi:hypothetical protein
MIFFLFNDLCFDNKFASCAVRYTVFLKKYL